MSDHFDANTILARVANKTNEYFEKELAKEGWDGAYFQLTINLKLTENDQLNFKPLRVSELSNYPAEREDNKQ